MKTIRWIFIVMLFVSAVAAEAQETEAEKMAKVMIAYGTPEQQSAALETLRKIEAAKTPGSTKRRFVNSKFLYVDVVGDELESVWLLCSYQHPPSGILFWAFMPSEQETCTAVYEF